MVLPTQHIGGFALCFLQPSLLDTHARSPATQIERETVHVARFGVFHRLGQVLLRQRVVRLGDRIADEPCERPHRVLVQSMLLSQPRGPHLRLSSGARLQARRVRECVHQCFRVVQRLGHLDRAIAPLRREHSFFREDVQLRAVAVRHRQLVAGTERLQYQNRLRGVRCCRLAATLVPRESREQSEVVALTSAIADAPPELQRFFAGPQRVGVAAVQVHLV
jgi:hypothetical protein